MHEELLPQLPSIKSTRFTTMGKGNRTDFSKLKRVNCEQFYNIPSDFNSKKPVGSAFSFGISREYYKKVYDGNNKSFDNCNPGPGKYDISRKLGSDAPKFSIYPKIEFKDPNINKSKLSPGPGEYKLISINPTGKFSASKFSNVPNIIFGMNKDKRFKYKGNKNLISRKFRIFIL